MLQVANTRSYFERRITMSDREKLIQYIANLTNEEAEAFIAFLKTAPSFEGGAKPLHPNSSQQAQIISA